MFNRQNKGDTHLINYNVFHETSHAETSTRSSATFISGNTEYKKNMDYRFLFLFWDVVETWIQKHEVKNLKFSVITEIFSVSVSHNGIIKKTQHMVDYSQKHY